MIELTRDDVNDPRLEVGGMLDGRSMPQVDPTEPLCRWLRYSGNRYA